MPPNSCFGPGTAPHYQSRHPEDPQPCTFRRVPALKIYRNHEDLGHHEDPQPSLCLALGRCTCAFDESSTGDQWPTLAWRPTKWPDTVRVACPECSWSKILFRPWPGDQSSRVWGEEACTLRPMVGPSAFPAAAHTSSLDPRLARVYEGATRGRRKQGGSKDL